MDGQPYEEEVEEDDVQELHLGEQGDNPRDRSMLLAGDDPAARMRPCDLGFISPSELHTVSTESSIRKPLRFGRGQK